MKGIIAYCAIDCTECVAYQTAMKNDLTNLESIEGWSGNGSKLRAKSE